MDKIVDREHRRGMDCTITVATAERILGVLLCMPENMRDGDWHRARAGLRLAINEAIPGINPASLGQQGS